VIGKLALVDVRGSKLFPYESEAGAQLLFFVSKISLPYPDQIRDYCLGAVEGI
jgi:hypothetical protein